MHLRALHVELQQAQEARAVLQHVGGLAVGDAVAVEVDVALGVGHAREELTRRDLVELVVREQLDHVVGDGRADAGLQVGADPVLVAREDQEDVGISPTTCS